MNEIGLALIITGVFVCILILIRETNQRRIQKMTTSVLDDNEKNIKTATKLEDPKDRQRDPEQLANQNRIKLEIKDWIHHELGGFPPNYYKTHIRKVWGNRYRVNIATIDDKNDVKFPLSYFIHYQKDAIQVDEKSPLKKMFDNLNQKKEENNDSDTNYIA